MAQEHCDVISVALINLKRSPYQPRTAALQKKDLDDLMQSLKAVGQTSPIVIQLVGGESDTYYVHQGERRWAAAQHLGWETIEAIVRTDLDERAARRIALADNLGREDLSACDQAKALADYANMASQSFEQSAVELGLSRTTAYRLKAVATASKELKNVLSTAGTGIRAADILARIEKTDGKKALRLALRHAEGQVSISKLSAELEKKRAPLRTAARKEMNFSQDDKCVQFRISVRRDMVTAEIREEILVSVAKLFSALGLNPTALASLPLSQ